ncbi:uncharacterized protein LOC108039980 isoform X1 [Drosophila rhopaloa]|uniref:Uncharacterized protein LOC108039980 isoform X1 n=1 Tax=Drosophila rhopaloa TaxID=1041015 RepID=A0A6P4EC08_DRORH|nr:uncharacterized protein LOC108039980 isoform X1 [Drosophila rhopaloa]
MKLKGQTGFRTTAMELPPAAATTNASASLQRVASESGLGREREREQEQAAAAPPGQMMGHHYHYIQYPAHFQPQQLQEQQPQPQQLPTCQCPCSCGRAPPPPLQHSNPSQNASMAVAVLVHQQTPSQQDPARSSPIKTQSAQSLLNHSYQALHEEQQHQEQLQLDSSAGAGSCDCDLECTCPATGGNSSLAQHKRSLLADAMLGADEITVSESDNNSTMIKKKKPRSGGGAGQLPPKTQPTGDSCNDIYHDTELDGGGAVTASPGSGIKSQILDDNRPPLPPRPPPRPRSNANGSIVHRHGAGIKKYVVWCLICGGFSCLLGVLFLGVYFLLHSYTITVGNFETVPTFVPATLLILTGVCIMSLARRRNRYSYLIKLSGACGLVSALTCALVTVTTTVLHMSRLQALRECEYAQKTRTCTCYSDLIESQVDRVDKEGVRLVFDSLSDCGVVHGSLYSCLRAIFGLSVAGVLIAVFSCMLVYQLLSHERKKMYWEQLELRCRSLYASQAPPPALGPGRMLNCRCCEQCHAHRQLTLPLQATAYPWDEATVAAAAAAAGGGGGEQRFWTAQPPGNFYSPNPGGEDAVGACRSGERAVGAGRSSSGWSWPRMPWQRTTPDTGRRFRQAAASPDSQYGFSSSTAVQGDGNQMLIEEPVVAAAYSGMPPPNALPYGVWGPPPPYSDPNSPARRGYYQYLQPTACLVGNPGTVAVTLTQEQMHPTMQHQHSHPQQQQQLQQMQLQRLQVQSATLERMDGLSSAGNVSTLVAATRSSAYKSKAEYENTPSDSDGGNPRESRERCSNTLPTRKLKKRLEAGTGAKSIGPQSNPGQQRPNVQQLFAKQEQQQQQQQAVQANPQQAQPQTAGVENSGYQDSNGAIAKDQAVGTDPAESEVYFADVSSCCNMSVKNDSYYDNAQRHQGHHHHHQHSNCSHSSGQSNANEDYLAQRFGRGREHSVRSRLPIPQTRREDDYESSNLNMPTLKEQQQQAQQLQKEISRQSMCSVESEAKTEFTDLSPSTPCGGNLPLPPPANFASDPPTTGQQSPSFVASFPYSSESQCLEAHRRSTKNIHELLIAGVGGGASSAGGDSHYEVINDRGNQPNPYQLQRSQQAKHKAKSKTRSREQLDIYGSGAERSDWSSDGGRL